MGLFLLGRSGSEFEDLEENEDIISPPSKENEPESLMLLPRGKTFGELPVKSRTPQNSCVKEKLLLGITPVTHEYYNQWARTPKLIDSSSSDAGQSTSETGKEHPAAPEPRAKTSLPRTGRFVSSRADLKSAHPRVVCRSTPPFVNVELPPMPSPLRRSVTVVGGERVSSVCTERSQSVFSSKKIVPSCQTLPMNQAVFLFKGDTFIHNSPFLGDPTRPTRAISRYSTSAGSACSQSLPCAKSSARVTLKGEVTSRPNATGPVQVAKVQFIDFSDVKSYVSTRKEEPRPKKQKGKQFLPLTIPLTVRI